MHVFIDIIEMGNVFKFRYSFCFPWKTPYSYKLNAKLTNEKSLPDTCHLSGFIQEPSNNLPQTARLKSGLKALPVLDSDYKNLNISSVRDSNLNLWLFAL